MIVSETSESHVVAGGDPNNSTAKPYYPRLDALRGLAALSVLIFHAMQSQGGLSDRLSEVIGLGPALFLFVGETIFNGGAAVILFFVLSGFVMQVHYPSKQLLTSGSYFHFLLRRAFRLVPVALVAIAFGGAVCSALLGTVYAREDLLRMMLLIDVSENGPLWSIRVELLVCLFYLPLLWVMRRLPEPFHPFVVMACLTLYFTGRLGDTLVSPYLLAFILGICIPSLGKPLIESMSLRTSSALGLLIAFPLYSCVPIGSTFHLVRGAAIIFESFGAFYIVAYVMYGLPTGKTLLDRRAVGYFGRISYPLYGVHYPIVVVIGAYVSELSMPLPVRVAMVLAFAVPLSIGLADLVSRFIERTFIVLGKRLLTNMTPSARATETVPRSA